MPNDSGKKRVHDGDDSPDSDAGCWEEVVVVSVIRWEEGTKLEGVYGTCPSLSIIQC